jgi:hypothetical protein
VELRVVGANGQGDRAVFGSEGVRWLKPFVSPDGSSILAPFERTNGLRQVATVRARRAGHRQVVAVAVGAGDEFFPDGQFAYQVAASRDAQQLDFFVLPTHAATGPPLERRCALSLVGQRAVRVTDDDPSSMSSTDLVSVLVRETSSALQGLAQTRTSRSSFIRKRLPTPPLRRSLRPSMA